MAVSDFATVTALPTQLLLRHLHLSGFGLKVLVPIYVILFALNFDLIFDAIRDEDRATQVASISISTFHY